MIIVQQSSKLNVVPTCSSTDMIALCHVLGYPCCINHIILDLLFTYEIFYVIIVNHSM